MQQIMRVEFTRTCGGRMRMNVKAVTEEGRKILTLFSAQGTYEMMWQRGDITGESNYISILSHEKVSAAEVAEITEG